MRNVSRNRHNRYDDECLLGIKIGGDVLPEFIDNIISAKETALDISLRRLAGETASQAHRGQRWQ